jgi:hypothetical protein
MQPIVLIGGTWSNTDPREQLHLSWWYPGSVFYGAVKERCGRDCYSFAWNTFLDGVIGPNTDWQSAGERLFNVCPPDASIITHSHGGQVVLLAAASGLRIKNLITVATPVRSDIPYHVARERIERWSHIYGNYQDYVQLAGSLMLGRLCVLRRQMALADKNIKYPANHADLMRTRVWHSENWWELV